MRCLDYLDHYFVQFANETVGSVFVARIYSTDHLMNHQWIPFVSASRRKHHHVKYLLSLKILSPIINCDVIETSR